MSGKTHTFDGWTYRINARGEDRISPNQKCVVCSKKIEAEFKDAPRNTDTWFWHQCSVIGGRDDEHQDMHCGAPVHEECSHIVAEDAKGTYAAQCGICYTRQHHGQYLEAISND